LPAELRLHAAQRLLLGEVTGAAPLSASDRDALLLSPPSGTRADRLAVYSNGYLARLAEALEGDYPAVRRILGPGAFGLLARRYLAACPPRSHDLGHAGDRLPRFLESDPLAAELPFLPDLAALERALAVAFVTEDAVPLGFEEIAALPCDLLPDLAVAPAPGVEVLRSRWPLVALLRCKDVEDDADVSLPLEGSPGIVLVHRRGLAAVCDEIGEDEAAVVEAGRWGGVTLAELQSRAERHSGEEGAARLAAAFRRLVLFGVFIADSTNTRTGDTGSLI
jgi:hypothetical protein